MADLPCNGPSDGPSAPQFGTQNFGRWTRELMKERYDGSVWEHAGWVRITFAERFPNTFTTIASEVIKSASVSSSAATGFKSVDGARITTRKTTTPHTVGEEASKAKSGKLQQIENSETDQIVVNETGKDKRTGEGHRFVQNGEAERPEDKSTTGNPTESPETGEVKDEPKSDDHVLPPQHQSYRNSDARDFDRRFPIVLVRRLRTWAGPIDSIELSPAERGNMSNSPGPRKRVRV